MEVDITQFLAAIVKEAGGEVKVAYDTFTEMTEEYALEIVPEQEGKVLGIYLIRREDIPDDVG